MQLQSNPDRSEIERIYNEAVRRSAEERTEFVRAACAGNDALRREVESLLAWDGGSELSRTAALKRGDRLGSFEILGSLGKGGMGEVYRARDQRLRREVAIKVLPPAFAAERARIARFEREARAASALNHPNIVAVYDVGLENSVAFIVSELVEGDTLTRLIERGPLPARKIVDIGAQIAAGLAAAHSAGIVHRDLKPANIMVGPEGRVKILDFGLAARARVAAQGDSTLEISGPGLVMGTPGYMSPEQVRGEMVDARSDLFSLGIILYEMASGRPAFGGDSTVERLNAVLKDEPADLPDTLPGGLVRIVRRCLEKDAAQRFQCAADLRFALEALSGPGPAPAKAATSPRWPVWAAAAALCALAIPAGFWYGARARAPAIAPDTTLRALTNDDGLTTDGTISRDGKLVAYASDRAGPNLDIWVQQVESGSTVRITDDPADDYDPAISPDGTQIAFRSDRERGGIFVAPTLGGSARLIIPEGLHPRWSPDGQNLMYSEAITAADEFNDCRLYVQKLSGGPPTEIGRGCAISPQSNVWSPDGSRILFSGGCNGEKSGVYVFGIDGKQQARLDYSSGFGDLQDSPEPIEDLPPLTIDQWLGRPSRLLIPGNVFNRPEGGSISLLSIAVNGSSVGSAQRIVFGTGSERHAWAAEDGRMVISSVAATRQIWSVPVDAAGKPRGSPRRVATNASAAYFGHLSRNGRVLLFGMMRAGRTIMKTRDLASGIEREIPWEGERVAFGVLNQDGSRVAYTTLPRGGGAARIYELAISEGLPRQIAGGEKPVAYTGVWDWSPDGTAMLFFANGRVDRFDLKSRSTTSVLNNGKDSIWQARYSPDGRWMCFEESEPKRARIFVAPARNTLIPRTDWILVSDSGWDDKPYFSEDGRTLLFSSERDGFRCIWGQRLGADMRPAGAAFAVYHSHGRRRSLRNLRLVTFNIAVGGGQLMFPIEERTGNLSLLESTKH